jgi:hypothetical protein
LWGSLEGRLCGVFRENSAGIDGGARVWRNFSDFGGWKPEMARRI